MSSRRSSQVACVVIYQVVVEFVRIEHILVVVVDRKLHGVGITRHLYAVSLQQRVRRRRCRGLPTPGPVLALVQYVPFCLALWTANWHDLINISNYDVGLGAVSLFMGVMWNGSFEPIGYLMGFGAYLWVLLGSRGNSNFHLENRRTASN